MARVGYTLGVHGSRWFWPRRVPRDVRDAVLNVLSPRFGSSKSGYMGDIAITTIDHPDDEDWDAVNKAMHRDLDIILTEAHPGWRRYYYVHPDTSSHHGENPS